MLKTNKMVWIIFCLVVNFELIKGYKTFDLENIIRRSLFDDEVILGAPRYPEHLPRAERVLPGHTLLKPTFKMLKSAAKYPQRSAGNVYGNIENIGITYGDTYERIRYTSFRKANVMAALINAIKNIKSNNNEINKPVLVIEVEPTHLQQTEKIDAKRNIHFDDENDGREILDDADSLFSDGNMNERRARKIKSDFRHRQSSVSTSSSEMSPSSDTSDYEKNAGNPYTIHKDRYKQNWLWDHNMDGNHMNINPFGPDFQNYGPSGAALFFGRKWWYFNQDDFIPLE